MSSASNDNGRAYEYACLIILNTEINKVREAEIIENSSYTAALNAWNKIELDEQKKFVDSAEAAVETIFSLEPLIKEDGSDKLELMIQPDSKGVVGDVRDILLIRRNIEWEIGLSVKHNHLAVKHSRLAKKLDFGDKWFGVPCTNAYWEEVAPIFEYLEQEKELGKEWKELPDKEEDVYIPLLNAFMNEVKRSNYVNKEIPKKMVEYLLGEFDFYKVISLDNKRITQIQTFNLRGTLNKANGVEEPKILVPIAHLPTRIVALEFKPNSSNTVELYLDEGWQFSFRIHNASTKVEPSLKFDVQIIGRPATIIEINCTWK